MKKYSCTVHYDDDETASVDVLVPEDGVHIEKCIARAAREKAEHTGQRNHEGGTRSERPHPTWAEVDGVEDVKIVNTDNTGD